eukprot:3922129-Prymnesium_polylepis.1
MRGVGVWCSHQRSAGLGSAAWRVWRQMLGAERSAGAHDQWAGGREIMRPGRTLSTLSSHVTPCPCEGRGAL